MVKDWQEARIDWFIKGNENDQIDKWWEDEHVYSKKSQRRPDTL